MAGNNKPSDIPQPQDDTVYRVKHISRSAWEDGTLNLPGLAPKAAVREEEPELDDVIMDMAMTGEIPLELIRSMLRKQEEQLRTENKTLVKGPTGGGMIRPEEIRPAAADRPARAEAAEAPTPEEVDKAKAELRAMKAKSRLPQPEAADESAEEPAQEPKKAKRRKEKKEKEAGPKLARRKEKYGEPAEEDIEEPAEEEESGGPELMGTIGLLSRMREGGPSFWDDAVPLYHIPLLGMLRAVYRSLYYYGLRFVRPLRIAGRTVLPVLATPLLTLWHLLRALAIATYHITIGRALRALEGVRETHARRLSVRKGRVHLRTILRGILVDYRPVLRPAANVLMPLAALMALLLIIQGVSSATYALEVTYDGVLLGNVVNKSVFEQALAAAGNNIVPRPETAEGPAEEGGGEETDKADQTLSAEFRIARINPEDIKSANDLTDQLLAAKGDMTSAYGLYIDDKLFASIKNRTDADIVLDNIKQTKAAELHVSESASVAFLQKVDLVPGRYPVAQLVDAQTLLERLSKPQREEKTVEVQAGDTPYSLVSRYQLSSVEELYALNPWMQEEGAKLHVGDPVKVRGELTRLEVKIIQIETRMEEVPFETRDTDNQNLFRGEIRIRVKGVPGQDKVTERVTYIDGVRIGQPEIISRVRDTDPVAERREIGQKNPVVTLPSGDTVKITPSLSGFQWPVPDCHRISSPYGYRGRSFHKGIDIADGNTNGKIIVAAKSGVVELIQLGGSSYGNMILINHGNGLKTRYAHIMTGSISVRQGESVSIGQPIARVGSTGNSTGPHLHFEVIVNGNTQNPTNYVKP